MGLRIAQTPVDAPASYAVDVTVLRGAVEVVLADQRPRLMSSHRGVGIIAWEFIMPSTIPGTGTWSFGVPALVGFPTQHIGQLFVGSQMVGINLIAGVIGVYGSPAITADDRVTLRAMVGSY